MKTQQSIKKKWISVLQEIINRNLKIHMILNLKVTDVIRDIEYLELYKRSGIVHVDLGMEGIEQEFLNKINKSTSVNDNKNAIQVLKKWEIAVSVNLLIGDRNENRKSLKKKFKIMRKWDPDFVIVYLPVPFLWTDLYNEAKDWIRTFDYEEWNYVNPIIIPKDYNTSDMINDLLIEYFKFVFRPIKLFKILFTEDKYKRKFTLAYIKDGILHGLYQKYRRLRPIIKFLHVRFHKKNKQPIFPLFGRGV
jgi:anaerobic magnesium-protoporphyrin IX monomethyl ester cyclase